MIAAITTTITKDELDDVDLFADEIGCSRTEVLRALIRYGLKHPGAVETLIDNEGGAEEP